MAALMLGFFGKDAPPLQAYGKLPIAKDYLRVGAGDGSGRELREWLDQGFSMGVGGGDVPLVPWPMRFVWNGGRGAPLLGCAWPSADAGGLRRFPFTLFVERRRKALVEGFVAGCVGETAWWERLEAFHAAHHNYSDGQAYLAELRGRVVDVAEGTASRESAASDESIAWHGWLAALWPDDPEEGMQETLHAIDALARKRHPGPLRLPLAAGAPMVEQVAAWCRALRELEWVERGELPSLFFPQAVPADAPPAFLVLLRRGLKQDDVRWLAPKAGEPGLGIGDLVAGAAHGARMLDRIHGPPLSDSIVAALARLRARSS